MNIDALKVGLLLMLIGMGFVFVFLSVMIFVMEINSKVLKFIAKFYPEEIQEDKPLPKKVGTKDDEIALAIACAVAKRSGLC
jgi:oxaloacetate decarboxylase gamma subunit